MTRVAYNYNENATTRVTKQNEYFIELLSFQRSSDKDFEIEK